MMADRILVLDDGRIAEEGTHALLHAAGGALLTLVSVPRYLLDSPPKEAISVQRPRVMSDGLDWPAT